MAEVRRHPPGRSGRLWLRRRLVAAERGSDQLSRKLRVLITEQQRLVIVRVDRQRDWSHAWNLATTWQLRAGIVGGQEALTRAGSRGLADVEVTWTNSVGLHYPAEARVAHSAGSAAAPPGNAAIPAAQSAFESALLAGVRLAVAEEAVRLIDAEVALTRRRVRALEKRWLPSLRASLTTIERSLEQVEQDDASRLRRAVRTTTFGNGSRRDRPPLAL